MKIIVPMAGMGKRMRPHTLSIPKPLLPIAGKPIVQRLVEDISKTSAEKITDIGFIVGNFGEEVEKHLKEVAASLGAKGHIFYQEEALGTAHAILCAKDILDGNVIVAFADTLFRADFKIDSSKDGIIWVQQVEDPSAFGVVKIDNDGVIKEFIEKPETFVSDLAIIGIYYFKDGANLKKELQFLIDNNIMEKGEYQLTNAMENMKNKGVKLVPGKVIEWLDCGNYKATVHTNARVVDFIKNETTIPASAKITNSTIIQPCYIGENVKITGSVVGPNTTISDNCTIDSSIIKSSIIYKNTIIKNTIFDGAMVGNFVNYNGTPLDASIGDYTTVG